MAQIKKIVKPGDAVRGAKVGLAALDKDGLVKSFPIPANSTGKYLGIDVSNNPGWYSVPSLPAWDQISDIGKTLILQNQGPEWQPVPTIYFHGIHIVCDDGETDIMLTVLKNTSADLTAQEFAELLNNSYPYFNLVGDLYISADNDYYNVDSVRADVNGGQVVGIIVYADSNKSATYTFSNINIFEDVVNQIQ